MSVDPIRHLEIFPPHAFGNKRVDVIGAGATGSRIVRELAKLGVENIHVWDFDKIEAYNVANQAFGQGHIGQFKAEALAKIIESETGTKITAHNERVDGTQELGEIVFLATDTMSSRKEIWEKRLKFRLKTRLLIETRMGPDSGRIYAFNPSKPSHIKEWEATLCTDQEAGRSACGASITVGPTAEIIAGYAVWQMIRWFSVEQGKEDDLDNEIIFSLKPTMTICRKF